MHISCDPVQVRGLFFAVGHTPAVGFLEGQLELDEYGYLMTKAGTTITSVPGVFAAGDVQDRKFRQAVTACASGEAPSGQGQCACVRVCVRVCVCVCVCVRAGLTHAQGSFQGGRRHLQRDS